MKPEYTIKATNKLPHSEVEITVEMPATVLDEYRKKAITALGKEVTLDGFRKGKVPENILISKIGEGRILEEAAELALQDVTPAILLDQKMEFITQPKVSVTKLAPGNPIEFKLTVATMPEIGLPDYKKIAKEEMAKKDEPINVTDEDVEKVILDIRKRMAPIPEVTADGKSAEPELPELNEELIKQLGKFEDVADFKKKLNENIKLERENKQREKKRIGMAEDLVMESKIDLPQAFVEQEIAIMLARFKDDIGRMGLKFDEYLKHIKKTEDDLRADWRVDAEKKAKLELVLVEIAKKENLKPEEEKVAKETDHLIEHYPTADRDRARSYIIKQMTQDIVFDFLEKHK
jgi:FKBP-type peptidyl-prolyl cis-trans isomerase (trigger factor)